MAGNSNIDAQVISKEIGNVMKRLLSEHHSFLTELKESDSSKGRRRSKKGSAGESASSSLDINRRLTGSIRNLNKHVGISASMFSELNASISKLKASAEKSEDQDNDARAAQKKMYDQLSLHINQSTNASKAMADAMAANTSSVRTNTDNTQHQTRTTGKNLSDFGKHLLKTFPILAQFKNVLNDVRQGAARTNQFGFFSTPMQSIAMGVTEQELIALQGDTRITALRSSGGMEQFVGELQKSMRDMIAFTGGDILEAHKVNAAMRTNLMNMGLSLEQATNVIGGGNDGLVGNLKHLANITGQTVDSINKTIGDIMSTDESRSILQRMGSDQRMDYLRTQGALYTQFLQMTGDEMKARQMLEQNNRDASKTMVQRFVEAAKASQAAMLAGAVTQQEANELRTLLTMNPALRGEDERERLQQLGNQVSQRIQELKGSGDLRTEFLGDKMIELIPDLNVYNTATYVPLDDQAVKTAVESSMATKIDESAVLKAGLETANRIEKILSSNIFKVLGSILGILMVRSRLVRGGLMKGMRALSPAVRRLPTWMQRPLPKIMRTGTTVASTGGVVPSTTTLGSTVANSANRATTVGSIADRARSTSSAPVTRVSPNTAPTPVGPAGRGLTTMGRFASAGRALTGFGAASMVADYALDRLYTPESVEQEQGKNAASGALNGAAIGAAIGSFILPGVGTAIGAALGGVTGAIYGYLKDTDSVEKYESRHNLMKSRALVQEIQDRKQAEMDIHSARVFAIRSELADNTEKRNLAVDDVTRQQLDSDHVVLERRLQSAEREHSTRMEQLDKESDVAEKTAALYEELDTAIDTKETIQQGIESATKRRWSTFLLSDKLRNRVDLGEYATPTNMSAQDIFTDVLSTLGETTVQSQIGFGELRELIVGNLDGSKTISEAHNSAAYRVLMDYFDAVQGRLSEDANKIRTRVDEHNDTIDTGRMFNEVLSTISSTDFQNSELAQTVPNLDNFARIIADGATVTERDIKNVTLTHEQKLIADKNNDGVVTEQEKYDMMIELLRGINDTLRKGQTDEAQRSANQLVNVPRSRPNPHSPYIPSSGMG